MPEKYLSETQGKPSIKLYCFTLDTPPESRALLGSGEEGARLRGGIPSAPRRKLLGSEEKIALYVDSQHITGSLFSTSDSTQEVILHNNLQSSLVLLPRAGSTQKFINTRYFPVA